MGSIIRDDADGAGTGKGHRKNWRPARRKRLGGGGETMNRELSILNFSQYLPIYILYLYHILYLWSYLIDIYA